jgi:hypothetical protein
MRFKFLNTNVLFAAIFQASVLLSKRVTYILFITEFIGSSPDFNDATLNIEI